MMPADSLPHALVDFLSFSQLVMIFSFFVFSLISQALIKKDNNGNTLLHLHSKKFEVFLVFQ